jgi:hypothetical protein
MAEEFDTIAPEFPGIDGEPYAFLAGAGVPENTLKSCCAKKVEVIGISSIAKNTIRVSYNGQVYEDVPVWMHTDYGCRRRQMLAEEAGLSQDQIADLEAAKENPELYFERAALQFVLPEGVRYTIEGIADVHTSQAPEALALVYYDEEHDQDVVAGVFSIINHLETGSFSTHKPFGSSPVTAWKTYRPYVLIEEKIVIAGSPDPRTYILYDMLNDCVAEIPNADFNGWMIADFASDMSAYNHFLYEGTIRLLQADYTVSSATAFDVGRYLVEWYGAADSCMHWDGTEVSPCWVYEENDWSGDYQYALAHTACHEGIYEREKTITRTDLPGGDERIESHTTETQILPITVLPGAGEDIEVYTTVSGHYVWSVRTVYTLTDGSGRTMTFERNVGFSNEKTLDSVSKRHSNGSLYYLKEDEARVQNFFMTLNDGSTYSQELLFDRHVEGYWGQPTLVDIRTQDSLFIRSGAYTVYFSQANFLCSFDLRIDYHFFTKRHTEWINGSQVYTDSIVSLTPGILDFNDNSVVTGSGMLDYVRSRFEDFVDTVDPDPYADTRRVEYILNLIFVPYNIKEAFIPTT